MKNSDEFRQCCESFEKSSGKGKVKCNPYKTRLRRLSCPVKKVSRVGKDENEPLIRLADALAGASAELIKYQNRELSALFSHAEQSGVLVPL